MSHPNLKKIATLFDKLSFFLKKLLFFSLALNNLLVIKN